MKMRSVVIAFIIAFLLQPFLDSVLPGAWMVKLDLVLVVILVLSCRNEDLFYIVSPALVMALLSDITRSVLVGPSVIATVFTILILLFLKQRTNTENLFIEIMLAAIGFLFYETIYWLIYRTFGSSYTYLYMLRNMVKSIIINTAITVPAMRIFVAKAVAERRNRYFR